MFAVLMIKGDLLFIAFEQNETISTTNVAAVSLRE